MRGHGKIFIAFFSLLLSHAAMAQMGGASRTPFLSSVNSTTTPLASGATFTGEWEQCFHWATISTAVTTDLDGTLKMQFSPDKTNVDSSLTYTIDAGSVEAPHKLEIFRRYCRVTFTNDGATTQSYLRLQTIYGQRSVPVSPRNTTIGPDQDAVVTRNMAFEFDLGRGAIDGISVINKFGANAAVSSGDTPEDVWAGGGVYTGFPTGAVATVADTVNVVSSSTADDLGAAGCEIGEVIGLGNDGLELTESVTLNGQSAVTSSNEFYRVHRWRCTQSANGANTAFNAGTITISHTNTSANVFTVVPAGTNQSRVCAYTVPANKTGYLKDLELMVSRQSAASVNGALWIREFGGVPRLIRNFTASNEEEHKENIYAYLTLPALTDITVRITGASTSNIDVECLMDIIRDVN